MVRPTLSRRAPWPIQTSLSAQYFCGAFPGDASGRATATESHRQHHRGVEICFKLPS